MITGPVRNLYELPQPPSGTGSARLEPAIPSSGTGPRAPADEALMASFCSGTDASFALLFDRYGAPIHRLMLRLTHDHAIATDLTQSTFLSVVKGRDRFVPGSRFRVWLYVIAMNAWRDYRRRGSRELLSVDGALPEGSYLPTMRDPGLEREVRAALGRLPDEQREVIVLHQLEEFSFKEIAELIQITESAAKVRAHRGYERLRALLGDMWREHHE